MLIELSEIKEHLRIDIEEDSSLDAELEAFYSAAVNYAEMVMNRKAQVEGETSLNSSIRAAILLLIGDFYLNREAQSSDKLYQNEAVNSILHFHRVELGI